MRIGILRAGRVNPKIAGRFGEYRAWWKRLFNRRAMSFASSTGR